VISTLGVSNLVVVRTADVTMICDRSRAEDVKLLVNQVKDRFPSMAETHLTVQRPWGSYTVLEEGSHFKIKSIEVSPHSKLSLQSHTHRSEHWVVVSGTATVINGDRVLTVKTNESTYIQAGNRHRLENNTDQPLIIIEVQTGERLTEDDIIRYDDIYGR
jgi:mannose-6-phosphate isomerase-like protein (cupin superfamily)